MSKLTYFIHLLDLRQSSNAQMMITLDPDGLKCYGALHIILEALCSENGLIELSKQTRKKLAFFMCVDSIEFEKILETLQEYDLIEVKDDVLTSKIAIESIKRYNEKREQRIQAGKKSAEMRNKKKVQVKDNG